MITKEQVERNEAVMELATKIFSELATWGSFPLDRDASEKLATIYQAAIDSGELKPDGEPLRGGFQTGYNYIKGKRVSFTFSLRVDDVSEQQLKDAIEKASSQ